MEPGDSHVYWLHFGRLDVVQGGSSLQDFPSEAEGREIPEQAFCGT